MVEGPSNKSMNLMKSAPAPTAAFTGYARCCADTGLCQTRTTSGDNGSIVECATVLVALRAQPPDGEPISALISSFDRSIGSWRLRVGART